jgi:hypothetical protein
VIGVSAGTPALLPDSVTLAGYPAGLPDSAAMQRTLAGVLFLVAGVAFSLAAGGWWMQRIVFTPDTTRSTAAAVLEEPDIRQEINNVVTGASAPVLGANPTELQTFIEDKVLSTRAGAAMMGPIIEATHSRIIGNRDDQPVVITGAQMVEIVRDQRAADVQDVILPVPVIGTLKTTNSVIGWIVPIAAALGAIVLLLGIFTRPDRRDVLRGLGEFGLAMAASMIVFGYLIPVHLLTAIDNGTWTNAVPRLALRTVPVLLGATVIFGLVGLALILASSSGGKRRQFSTPLSVARYRGGDNPGWS